MRVSRSDKNHLRPVIEAEDYRNIADTFHIRPGLLDLGAVPRLPRGTITAIAPKYLDYADYTFAPIVKGYFRTYYESGHGRGRLTRE